MNEKLKTAHQKAIKDHLGKEGITGVVIGYKHKDGKLTKQICIGFRVAKKKPLRQLKKGEVLPKTILGVSTDVVEATYKPHQRERFTTLLGGISIGPQTGSVGTLGCIVYDSKGNTYGLTAGHCAFDGGSPKSSSEYVVQPGLSDGGSLDSDRIGAFTNVSISESGDFALIQLDSILRSWGTAIDISNAVLTQAINPGVGYAVEKVGRTTGLTDGTVTATGLYLIEFSTSENASGPIMINGFEISSDTAFSLPGDSGSLIYMPGTPKAVGIVTAGNNAGTLVIGSYLTVALQLLGVSLQQAAVTFQTPATDPTQMVYSLINAGWVGAASLVYTVDIIFNANYSKLFLYVDPEYAGLVQAKFSTESDFLPVNALCPDPTCILGDVVANVPMTIDLQLIPNQDVVGEQIIPIKIGYGDLVSYGGKLSNQFSWKNSPGDVEAWGIDESEENWLVWSDDIS